MSEFAGSLRERVLLLRQEHVRTAAGLLVGEWVGFAHCHAAVVPDGVGTEAEGMTLSQMPRYRVTLRPIAGLTIDQRIQWRDRIMGVRQVIDDPRTPDRILLRCEEVRT